MAFPLTLLLAAFSLVVSIIGGYLVYRKKGLVLAMISASGIFIIVSGAWITALVFLLMNSNM